MNACSISFWVDENTLKLRKNKKQKRPGTGAQLIKT
jgi:hypothetical protein